MTKSELIAQIAAGYHPEMTKKQVEFIINNVFDAMKEALINGEKVEIRRFGSFTVRGKKARLARNPRTGKKVNVPPKKSPYFRPGREIREGLIK